MSHSMSPRAGGGAGDLGTWEAGDLRGRVGEASRRGPDVAPEWARARRAGAGHDDPHGAARRGGGGEREVRSVRPQMAEPLCASRYGN